MIRPMGRRVLITRLPEPKPQTSLIIQPDSVLDKPSQYAIVMAVGSRVTEALAVGDTVILKDFVGAPVPPDMADGIDNAFIVSEDEVLMIVGE